jgi:hypothetical protein
MIAANHISVVFFYISVKIKAAIDSFLAKGNCHTDSKNEK